MFRLTGRRSALPLLIGALLAGVIGLESAARAAAPSLLDRRAALPGYGQVAYRAPVVGARGPVLVLVHGVFAGSTHRSFSEITPVLDGAGARVYLLDLLGAGDSARPRRAYDLPLLDGFVESFLQNVVREPATVVAESVLGTSALVVATARPDLVSRVVLLSPTGIRNLASPPSADQTRLYDAAYNNDLFGFLFYQALLSDPSLRFFLQRAYVNDALVTDALLDEFRLARANLGQRWLSFSFVGGKLYRSFDSVAGGVSQPVLALFGAGAESVGFGGEPERAADFRAVRPDFEYREVPGAGQSLQREQPQETARLILDFIARN